MNYLHAAESMGATTFENICLVILPAASAEIFDSIESAMAGLGHMLLFC